MQAFLDGGLSFDQISTLNEATLDQRPGLYASIDELLAADTRARELARARLATRVVQQPPGTVTRT